LAIFQQQLSWQARARCVEVDPEIFFPDRGGSSKAARAVCRDCSVQTECLKYALANREQFGIWGGTSERERRRLRRVSVPRKITLAS
jgi:WhiB family transcriptional regulator, redox-sensing transcriptional regulator